MTTPQPLFPVPLDPPQFERVVGFRDHKAPPSTPVEMDAEISDWIAWGWTDICMGVTNVVGSRGVRLLRPDGGATEASALAAWQMFAERCIKRGVRVHLSLWHKPAWHDALCVLTPRIANALGSMCSSVIWDIEGETLRYDVVFDHATAARDISRMKSVMPCPWGVTVQIAHMQNAPRRVRPYLKEAAWNLCQVLGFENAKRSMGLKNPATLPGFYHEQAIDLLDTAYSWLREHCHTTVLIAAYWQDIRGVDSEDVLGAACSSLLAAGRRDVGVFSDGWMRKGPDLVAELLRRTDNPRADAGVDHRAANADTTEMVFTVDDVMVDHFGVDALTRPTMESPMKRITGAELDHVYGSIRAGFAGHGWVFPVGEYETVRLAIRSTERIPDAYNDLQYILRRTSTGDVLEGWVMAYNTIPSVKYLVNPVRMARNRGGTLIVQHPQQSTRYVHAPHMGKYNGSLCQYKVTGAVDGWRDGNRNRTVEIDGPDVKEDRGLFGANEHRGGRRGTGSAGCFTYPPALQDGMETINREQTKRHGARSFARAVISEEEWNTWI